MYQGVLHLFKDILIKKASEGETLILHQQRQNDVKTETFYKEITSQIENISVQIHGLSTQQDKESKDVAISHDVEVSQQLTSFEISWSEIYDGKYINPYNYFGRNKQLNWAIEALEKDNFHPIVIWGEPGIGKTAFVRELYRGKKPVILSL